MTIEVGPVLAALIAGLIASIPGFMAYLQAKKVHRLVNGAATKLAVKAEAREVTIAELHRRITVLEEQARAGASAASKIG